MQASPSLQVPPFLVYLHTIVEGSLLRDLSDEPALDLLGDLDSLDFFFLLSELLLPCGAAAASFASGLYFQPMGPLAFGP